MLPFSHLQNGAKSSTFSKRLLWRLNESIHLHRACPTHSTGSVNVSHYYNYNCASRVFNFQATTFWATTHALGYSFGPIRCLPPRDLSLPFQSPFSTAHLKTLQEPELPCPISARCLTRRPWLGPRGAHRPAPGPGRARQMRRRRRQQAAGGATRGTAAAAAAEPGFAPSRAPRRPTCSLRLTESRTLWDTSSSSDLASAPRPVAWPRPLLLLEGRPLPPRSARWRLVRLTGERGLVGGGTQGSLGDSEPARVELLTRSVWCWPKAVSMVCDWCLTWRGRHFTFSGLSFSSPPFERSLCQAL